VRLAPRDAAGFSRPPSKRGNSRLESGILIDYYDSRNDFIPKAGPNRRACLFARICGRRRVFLSQPC